MSGLSGEFFVAAELLKRGIQTSVTFGNAKAIDLLAHYGPTGKTFSVQVKALRKRNFFLIRRANVIREHIYAFVILNKPGEPVEYFIVPGSVLDQNQPCFDRDFDNTPLSGISWRSPVLAKFKDNWRIFLEA